MNVTALARRVASGALLVALAAGAMLIYAQHERDYDKEYAPLMAYGSVGKPVDAGPFSVRVDKVTVAKSVSEAAYGNVVPPLRTAPGAVFVVVDGSVMAAGKPAALKDVELRGGDGTQYGLSGKGTSGKFTDSIAQPGYWIAGAWLFEVPRGAVAGLHLQVGDQQENDVPRKVFPHLGFELNPGADIDLGFTGSRAASLLAHPPEKVSYREPQE